MSTITIVGNLAADPELRFTPNGAAVAKFSVGESRRVKDEAGNWTDGPTSWHDATAWRHLAEHVAESCRKGARVIVVGELEQRSWEDKETGKRRYAWGINARHVGVDLQYGTATFTKSARSTAGPAAGDDAWATASRTRPPAPAVPSNGAPATHTGAPAQHSGGSSEEPPF